MRHQAVIPITVQQMVCTGCGSETNATCNCGKPYVPKKQRALEKARENPKQSVRALAEEVGVGHGTAQRALEEARAGVPDGTAEGRDGKVYRLPVREPETDDIEQDIEPDNRRGAFLLRADQARAFAEYTGPADQEVLKFARAAAQAWQSIAVNLERKLEEH